MNKIPIIGLAPMAGYTDSAFRQLVKSIYKDTKVVTELISADGLNYASKNTQDMLKHEIQEKPLSVQLFGKHPEFFDNAAKIAVKMGASEIDINMGCPAKKVVQSGHGSALTLKPCLAYEILEKTIKAVNVPVSVKLRLGWDRTNMEQEELSANLIKFCKGLEDVGVNHIVVHGRTVKQGYSGVADWQPIYDLKNALNVPVIGNGDIKTPEDAFDKIKNLDGIFVGRAAVGDPWIFKRIFQKFNGEKVDDFPEWKEREEIALLHMELNIATKGMKKGMLEMRKHFALYVKGLQNAKEMRNKLVRVESPKQVLEIMKMAEY